MFITLLLASCSSHSFSGMGAFKGYGIINQLKWFLSWTCKWFSKPSRNLTCWPGHDICGLNLSIEIGTAAGNCESLFRVDPCGEAFLSRGRRAICQVKSSLSSLYKYLLPWRPWNVCEKSPCQIPGTSMSLRQGHFSSWSLSFLK